MSRIYISGPITKDPDFFLKFREKQKMLEESGYRTCNPAYLAFSMPKALHSEYMHVCYAMLDNCDAIYMMDGWNESDGARQERERASKRGMPIVYEKTPLNESDYCY